MSRSRRTLHQSKMAEFKAWCESKGWVWEPSKGHEVLRMRHPEERMPMFVHCRDGGMVHMTTWGRSQELLNQWLRERTLANFGGTVEQARELAQRGVDRVEGMR